ncbi:MAG: DUF2252 domain-containing protein [Candidatus Obscuribacterales bacterium]|nr:DUF2252 domain-containing protein [Candidatus Obscuribacterales bacterium]
MPGKEKSGKVLKNGAKKSRNALEIICKTNDGRLSDLVPIRHSRMLLSPFTYYRGAAAVMAADLAAEKNSGIFVQSCGDCHILNFGAFATPERNVIIDLNDFDETHPAPFEWDLKRLAASMVLAVASGPLPAALGRAAAYDLACAYQKEIAAYAEMKLLDIWYSKIDYQHYIDTAVNKAKQKHL